MTFRLSRKSPAARACLCIDYFIIAISTEISSITIRMKRKRNMLSRRSRPKGLSLSSNVNGKRHRRLSGGMLIGAGITLLVTLLAVGVFASQKLIPSHAASANDEAITTIAGLQTITQIGSTTY